MKGFLQEYGVIMVVVAVVLGMLAFGKTGYAKSIQDAILGSADHIVETGENITKPEIHVNTGDMLNIGGSKYIVLEEKGNNQALVMTTNCIGYKEFQSSYDKSTNLRSDGQRANTYEGSDVDKYLENDWYKGLSTKMQSAIQTTNIKQASYYNSTPYPVLQGEIGNTIGRHVFLPSVSEISKVVDLKKPDKINEFLDGSYTWTRDSDLVYADGAECLSSNILRLAGYSVKETHGVRPAFVIDLSKVDYTEAGHVDYK